MADDGEVDSDDNGAGGFVACVGGGSSGAGLVGRRDDRRV